MARPNNKEELIRLSEENLLKLYEMIDKIPNEQQTMEFAFTGLNRTIRDVLCHLHEWHLMLENWYEVGMRGDKPLMPAKGYTWKTTPELNRMIKEKYMQTELITAAKLLRESHHRMLMLIDKHTNEELFTKKYYKWTGTTSLGVYFVSNMSSHYEWGCKIIKKFHKQLGLK